VLLAHAVETEALDGLREVEVDATADELLVAVLVDLAHGGPDTLAVVALVLRGTRGDVAGDQVAEGGVDPLEVVVAVLLGDVARVLLGVGRVLGDPDATVVAQRL